MGEPALQTGLLSVEEYLAFEEKATVRHEYWNGYLRAMAGASEDHVTLSYQLAICLGVALADHPCRVGGTDLAVRLNEANSYVYPDTLVWCEESQFQDGNPRLLLTPTVIAEVLSPSSISYDRGYKLQAYLRIPSLSDYLILSPQRVSIEHYARGEDGRWVFTHYVRRDEKVKFAKLEIELSVGDIYRKLNVPEGLRIVDLGNGQIAEE